MSGSPDADRILAGAVVDIDGAVDEASLCAATARAQQAVIGENAYRQALTLAAGWSTVMGRAVAAAARLVGAQESGAQESGAELGWPAAKWSWSVTGSVARGEAIPGSDFETLVVLDDAVDDTGKTRLLALAADVHTMLERCGLQPDTNGVLASRSRFCRRHASWVAGIESWCAEPAEDRGVVMAGLLADSAGVSSTGGAGGELRCRTVAAAREHPQCRRAILQDATSLRAVIPSRLRVFASQDDSVDLKAAAVEPIVKIARWAALSGGSAALPTLDRLADAAAAAALDADDAAMLRECYLALCGIRWRTSAQDWIAGGRVTGRVSLAELAPQERAAVRTVARELARLRRKLHFLASMSAFG